MHKICLTRKSCRSLPFVERHKCLWVRLKEITNIKSWPELARPAWLVNLAWIVSVVCAVFIGVDDSFGLGIFIGLSIFTLIMLTTRPMKKVVPSYYSNVENLVRFIVSANPSAFKNDRNWSKTQIKEQMKNIVMEVLGTDQYDEKWKFVEDFGIG